jgi:PAS domain S-box-containing protein
MNPGTEHQELLQFLYAAPVGLIHASAAGDIELINSASARWLLPLSPDGKLKNLFSALATVAPGLRETAEKRTTPGVIVDHLRIEATGPRRRLDSPEFVMLTLTRLDDRRLMATLTDVTQQVRDERALSDSEAHYRAVVSVLSEGIVVHAPDGRLLMCNAAAQRIVGAPLPALHSDAALARGWAPLWPDGRPMAAADTPTGIVLAGGPAQERVPVLSITASGERRWFEVSAQPVVRPTTTEVLAVVTSFTDVTQRQALQEELHHHREHLQELVTQRTRELEASNAALSAQQRLFRDVADAVPGMIGYWDADLRCRFSNQAYLEWFGITPESMIGMRMQDLAGGEVFTLHRPHVEAALRGEPQHFQRTIRKQDGTVGHTLASFIPDLADGRVRGFSEVVSDVTELKQAEFRLGSLNEQLRQRAREADAATQAKSAFLANMSHEIRTPMNAIIGLSHLMRHEARDPQQLSRLRKIDDASQHLLQLINDILDLSKIEAGKMSLVDAEFDTQALLARSLGLVSDQAREKSLEIRLDCDGLPPRLRGDFVRLSQCLINLLGNAVKFTDRGSISVRGFTEQVEGTRAVVRFEVQDTGPGIPADRLPALFNPFEQADSSSTRRHGGTGLGLALTRHFAQLMGGSCGVTSVPGTGSTFWFTASLGVVEGAGTPASDSPWRGVHAPRVDRAEETAAQASAAAASSSLDESDLRVRLAGRRVLLAEDNPINREVAVELLELVGLTVEVAVNGAQAVDALQARSFDIVLMDVQMPQMDGLTATRELRRRGIRTPILALTANAFEEERAACLAAGMNDHVAKPVNPALLYDALLRWLPGAPDATGATPPTGGSRLTAAAPGTPRQPLLQRLSAGDGFDPKAALRTVGGDVAMLERVLRRFTQVYGVAQAASAFDEDAPVSDRLASLAHSLRSACASIGLEALQRDLARFERELADQPGSPRHRERARALADQLRQRVSELQSALEPPSGTADPPPGT